MKFNLVSFLSKFLLSQLLRPLAPGRPKLSSKNIFNSNFFFPSGKGRLHTERKEGETRILLSIKGTNY